jgi:hypothetical protein
MYLILPKQQGTLRTAYEALKRGCNMSTTKAWWVVFESGDDVALDVGDGEGLEHEELDQCVESLPEKFETPVPE